MVNLVREEFGPLMGKLANDYSYEVSEIDECGLTEAKLLKVKPPRIAAHAVTIKAARFKQALK